MTSTESITAERDRLSAELAEAVAAETAAIEALTALEAAVRQGGDVHPAELAEAAGNVSLRRLRREQLAAEAEAAAAEAAESERAEALGALAARAAANPALNNDRLRELERKARAAAEEYLAALEAADRAFHDMAQGAAKLGVRVAGKDAPDADLLIAGATWRSGRTVRFADPTRLRLAGREYAPSPANAFANFSKAVSAME